MKDYLKYIKVIRKFIQVKYKISLGDLELLLFLRSEKYFSRLNFEEYSTLFGWEKDRFDRLRQAGWIDSFRVNKNGVRALYQLSYKAQRMITSFYKKIEGEEIPESKSSNPMFLANVPYTDKVFRHYIKKMNKVIQQERHRSQK
jgi:hypothetical protein